MTKDNYVVFADLDGTLLDKRTFQSDKAFRALNLCYKHDIPVVFVSGKTSIEIEAIRTEFNNKSPFVAENGGGLYLPIDDFDQPDDFEEYGNYWRLKTKVDLNKLRETLKQAATSAKIEIRCFSEMTLAEIAILTSLDVIKAKLAQIREYDEPFQIINETPGQFEKLAQIIKNTEYYLTPGRRFYHMSGNYNIGGTLQILKNIYLKKNPNLRFIGLGDAYNDLSLLQVVDHPFLVRKPDGDYSDGLDVAGLKKLKGIGPDGFMEAISSFLT